MTNNKTINMFQCRFPITDVDKINTILQSLRTRLRENITNHREGIQDPESVIGETELSENEMGAYYHLNDLSSSKWSAPVLLDMLNAIFILPDEKVLGFYDHDYSKQVLQSVLQTLMISELHGTKWEWTQPGTDNTISVTKRNVLEWKLSNPEAAAETLRDLKEIPEWECLDIDKSNAFEKKYSVTGDFVDTVYSTEYPENELDKFEIHNGVLTYSYFNMHFSALPILVLLIQKEPEGTVWEFEYVDADACMYSLSVTKVKITKDSVIRENKRTGL